MKATRKWLASLLAVVMVLVMLPCAVFAEGTDLGAIEKITEVGTVDGDTITVQGFALDWYPKDDRIGRYDDGWWVGVNIIAPAFVTETNVANVKYSNDGTDNLEKNFGKNKDGTVSDGRYYMGCWLPVEPKSLEKFIEYNANLQWKYKFDWNGDGTVDQTFTISVDPKNATLKKDNKVDFKTVDGNITVKDGKPFYSVGTIEEITKYGKVNGSDILVAGSTLEWSQADPKIGRNEDAWWVGAKIIAPTTVTEVNVANVKYSNDGTDNLAKSFGNNKDGKVSDGRYYMGCWVPLTPERLETALADKTNIQRIYKFDWDGNGTVDQTFTITIDPNNITLKDPDGQGSIWCQTENGVMTVKKGCRHAFGTEWKSDETNHWHECVNNCGEKKDIAAHTTTVEKAKETTCTEDGYTGDTVCTICRKVVKKGTVIPALGHTLTKYERVEPTCVDPGKEQYWECTVCHKLYADAAAMNEIKDKTTLEIAPTGHKLTKTAAKEATCTEPGNVEYWHCDTCGKNYSDQAATKELSDVTVPPTGHKMTKNPAVAATTEKEGNLEYYVCENEKDVWYRDAEGKNLIENHNDVVTAKLTEETKDLQDKGTSITVETKAEGKVEETVSNQAAAQQAANSAVVENKDSLVDNVAKVAQAVSNDETLKATAKAELEKNGADLTNNKMELVVKPYPVVTITDDKDGVLSLQIELYRSVEAVAGDVRVPLEKEKKQIDNEDITQPTTISMVIPDAYQGAKYIRHTLRNGYVKYYPVTTQGNVITFTVPAKDGFSPFVLIAEDATVTVKLDGETKTYNRTDVVNETALPTPSKYNYAFKGWKFEGIENQHFNMTAWLFEELLANDADTTVVNAASVFEGPLSEHPEIEEAKKNGTWGVDESKPAATAKPAAAAVTPVRTSSIPKTSDDSNLMLWVCLMGLAALGLGGAVYMKKRNSK